MKTKTPLIFSLWILLMPIFASAQTDSSGANISFTKDKQILKLGRRWTYRLFFINPGGDTADSREITLDIVKGTPPLCQDNKGPLQVKWTYFQKNILPNNAHRFEDLSEFSEDSNSMDFPIACYVELSFTRVFGYTQVGRFLEKGREREYTSCDIYTGRSGGEAIFHIKEYSKIVAKKDVPTLMKVFPGCFEIDEQAKSEKGTYKATYYFHPRYGFVRLEYTKLDTSRVIFDLVKVSGFESADENLNEKSASFLAADLANQECEKMFNARPFLPGHYKATFSDGRWKWGYMDARGIKGYSAEVSFKENGTDEKVRVFFSTDNVRKTL